MFFHPPQVNRAQYQNGLLASKLDSTPQSPQSNHIRLDSVLAPPLTLPTSSMTCITGPLALREEKNETTALLNDKNSLNCHQTAQPQSYSNSNSNLNTSTDTNYNLQSQSYPNTHVTPHIHTISHSHAHTESTIWQSAWGALVGARLQRGPHLSTNVYTHTRTPIHVHGHLQTICSLTQKHFYRMNFGAGLVSSSSSNSPCMPPFFPLLCPVRWHFSGISNGDVSSRSTSDFSLCRCSLRD